MNTLPVSVSTLFLVAIGGLFLWVAHRAQRTREIRGILTAVSSVAPLPIR